MTDVNKTLTRIENLLTLAEQELKQDDGRLWPTPPVPPDDPCDYNSCKEYVLRNVRWRPLLRPRMFPKKLADMLASTACSMPGTWVRLKWFYGWYDEGELARGLRECRELYGMEIQIRKDEAARRIFWSGHFTRQLDMRVMTYAQRMVELRLLRCRKPILHTWDALLDRAYVLSRILRLVWKADLRSQFESALAYHYTRDVATPLPRLGTCVLRFNRLSKALYKSPKRRFPITGYGLGLDTRIKVPYPWWHGTRIHWRALCDVVSGASDSDPQMQEEREKWKSFQLVWATAEPESLKDILLSSLFHCVGAARSKARRTCLELLGQL